MKVSREIEAKILAAAVGVSGPPPVVPKRRREPRVITGPAGDLAVVLVLPCRVVSEANARVHWATRRRRFREQAGVLLAALSGLDWYSPYLGYRWPFGFPTRVVLTHVGPRMDSDNLAGAFKGLRDAVAEWAGVDDGGREIVWDYEQRPGKPGVEIRIQSPTRRVP